ncbi:MAG: MFS transporter [Nocardioidaceae bacterium]|nr:MFS transporter [Nocardioidaceae bacterium]
MWPAELTVLKSPFIGLPREVAVLVAVAVAVAVGFGVVAPAIPLFAKSFGVGSFAAGAVISAFAVMRFASALGGGRLVDAFGERAILAIGIGIVAVSTGLAGLAQSYPQLLVLRGLGGIGSAMFTVSAIALLFRVVDSGSRGRASGLFQGGFLIGGLLGPLAGGFLTGVSLRLPFFVYAISLAAAGGIGALFLSSAKLRPVHKPADGDARSAPDKGGEVVSTTVAEAWAQPAYRSAVMVNFAIGWALFGVRMSLIPIFVTDAMGQRAVWIGAGFLCSSVAQAALLLVAGQFVDRRGRRPAMVLGSAVTAAAFVTLAFSSVLPVFLVAMTAIGVGGAFVGTAPGAVVGDIMKGRGGRVVAAFQMASDLGAITGPLAAGWLVDNVSFASAFFLSAAVLLVAMVMSLRMPETLRRDDVRPRRDGPR